MNKRIRKKKQKQQRLAWQKMRERMQRPGYWTTGWASPFGEMNLLSLRLSGTTTLLGDER